MNKFKGGQRVFYVDVMFNIEKVTIEFADDGLGSLYDNATTYYVDSDGAYLEEHSLFESLEEAKSEAIARLQQFFEDRFNQIEMTGDPDNVEGLDD